MNHLLKHVSAGLVLVAVLASCNFCPCCHDCCKHQTTAAPIVASKTIFSFLGAPGSGKGTLSEQAVNKLGFKTVSTGNLCREEIASGSAKGTTIASYLKNAQLIPDDMITDMVQTWLSKQTGDTPIILDGYPRSHHQAELLAQLLKEIFPHYKLRVIALTIDDEDEVVKRISNRLVCSNKQCQAVYNRDLLKDKTKLVCEKCASPLIQREDDKEEVVRRRLQEFNKNNQEIIDFYTSAGITVEQLPVSHATPEQVFDRFKGLLSATIP